MPVSNSLRIASVRYGAWSGVSTIPGGITLQRILSRANWIASDLVREMSAPFAAGYAAWARGEPTRAGTEPLLMIEPPPARWGCGVACFVTPNTHFRLI